MRERTTFRGSKTLSVEAAGEWFYYGPECAKIYPVIRLRLAETRAEYLRRTIPLIREGRAKYPGKAWWKLDPYLGAQLDSCDREYRRQVRCLFRAMRVAAEQDTIAMDIAWLTGEAFPFQPCNSPLEAVIRYGLGA